MCGKHCLLYSKLESACWGLAYLVCHPWCKDCLITTRNTFLSIFFPPFRSGFKLLSPLCDENSQDVVKQFSSIRLKNRTTGIRKKGSCWIMNHVVAEGCLSVLLAYRIFSDIVPIEQLLPTRWSLDNICIDLCSLDNVCIALLLQLVSRGHSERGLCGGRWFGLRCNDIGLVLWTHVLSTLFKMHIAPALSIPSSVPPLPFLSRAR